jgi:hypothetical protein
MNFELLKRQLRSARGLRKISLESNHRLLGVPLRAAWFVLKQTT